MSDLSTRNSVKDALSSLSALLEVTEQSSKLKSSPTIDEQTLTVVRKDNQTAMNFQYETVLSVIEELSRVCYCKVTKLKEIETRI